MVSKELEKAGVSTPEALDKSYWIQRVGEVIFHQAISDHRVFPIQLKPAYKNLYISALPQKGS